MTKQTMRAMDLRVYDSSTSWNSMTSLDADLYSVDTGGGARNVGEGYAASRDYAHQGAGKRGRETVTVNCLYDSATTGAWTTVRGYHDTAGGTIYMRWSAAGSVSGAEAWYTKGGGIVTECPPPGGNVENGEPISFSFGVSAEILVTESL